MKRPILIAAGLAALIAGPATAVPLSPQGWTVGPVVRGVNKSRGVAARPRAVPGGMEIVIPGPGGSANYVTTPSGSLAGKRRIVIDFTVETAPGVTIRPVTGPAMPSLLTLYFQRRGDNWSGRGPFETYRWYATFASKAGLVAGRYRMVAPLDSNWTAIQSSSARTAPAAFAAAKAEAGVVGFVLGGGDGYGHGVFADGPARIVVNRFAVE